MSTTDRARALNAMAKLGRALGVELDLKRPDHELVEQLAQSAETCLSTLQAPGRALSTAWVEGWNARKVQDMRAAAKLPTTPGTCINPYKRCSCPACTRSGNA